MPSVPISERRVRTQGLPGENVRAANFGGMEAVGRSMQQLGAEGAQAANVWEAIHLQRDENDAKRADTAAALALNKRMRVDEDAFLGRQGANARDITAAADAEFKSIRETTAAGLKSKRAQEMFGRIFDERVSRELAVLGGHEREQVRVDTIETAKASAETIAGLAVDSSEDEEAFGRHIADGKADIDTIAKANGWSPAITENARAEFVSKINRRVVEKLRLDDPRKAEEWINRRAAEINDKDETDLRQSLVAGLEEAQYEDDLQAILSGPTPPIEDKPPEAAPSAPRGPSPEAVAFKPQMIVRSGVRGQGSAQHRARGSDNAVDIPGRMGDPVYPPIEGKVIQVGSDEKSGNFVLVRHADGRTTGYAHLSRITAQKGDDVGPLRPIGGLGSTGKSTGPHVHFTVRNAAGVKVDPETQKWGGARGAGEAIVEYKPTLSDTEALYTKAASAAREGGWSQKRYERVLRGIDAMANRNQSLLADKERRASRAAAEAVLTLGPGGLTDIKQLGSAFYEMSPAERGSYIELVRKNNEPKEPEWDPMLMLQLSDQLARDPAGFANRNVAEDLKRLPKSAQTSYISMRRSAIGQAKPDEVSQVAHSRIVSVTQPLWNSIVGPPVYSRGKEKKAQEQKQRAEMELQYRTEMAEQIRRWQKNNPGKDISDDDILGIGSRLLTRIKFAGESGDERGFAFQNMNRPIRGVTVPNSFIAEVRRRDPDASQSDIARYWLETGVGGR